MLIIIIHQILIILLLVLFNNSVLLQFGKKSGEQGPRTVTLPVAYISYYSVSAINRDGNNKGASCVKLQDGKSNLTSFVGIGCWALNGNGYSTATWDWITIGY